MGELARTYNAADVAYVGGGLTPEVGLHNLVEPLVCGAPLLFGHHHGKAHRIAAEVSRARCGIEVKDGAELLAAVRRVLRDPETRTALVDASHTMLARHRGAAVRLAARIGALLP
jgi:3-deoxy-D-manno-octulosonic-acid transferase